MTLEQRVAVLEEIFAKIQDYYTSAYSGEEIDARLASAGVPIGITKEYKSVAEMNQDFTGTDVKRGQFVLILPDITASADYGKVYLKGTANWVYAFTLTTLTSIKGPIGPPGKKGDQGDPGEAGSSFAILGYFDTLDDLKAAVPNPKAGDVYGVGTAPPYNIYIWDTVHGKWVGNGNLQGPQGKQGIQGPEGKQGPEGPVGGSSNFVRYDAAQSLTDEQKAQARANIGADTVQGAVRYDAAQSLSDTQKAQARDNIGAAKPTYLGRILRNKIYKIGFYISGSGESSSGAVTLKIRNINEYGFENYMMVFLSYDGACNVEYHGNIGSTNESKVFVYSDPKTTGSAKQFLIFVRTANYADWTTVYIDNEHSFRRDFVDVTDTFSTLVDGLDKLWESQLEYANPPMNLGIEYRTTERYRGKPVYVKLVDCGEIADGKTVAHGISNMNICFSVMGVYAGQPMPQIYNHLLNDPWTCYVANVDKTNIVLACGAKAVGTNCQVMVKYTKTTD